MRAPSLPKAPVAGEGSAGVGQVLKLPFQVTSVTSSLKRVGVLLLLGFFSCYKSLSTFSEYFSSCQVRYEGSELPRAVSEHQMSPATLSLKGPTSAPQVWLFSDPSELL